MLSPVRDFLGITYGSIRTTSKVCTQLWIATHKGGGRGLGTDAPCIILIHINADIQFVETCRSINRRGERTRLGEFAETEIDLQYLALRPARITVIRLGYQACVARIAPVSAATWRRAGCHLSVSRLHGKSLAIQILAADGENIGNRLEEMELICRSANRREALDPRSVRLCKIHLRFSHSQCYLKVSVIEPERAG